MASVFGAFTASTIKTVGGKTEIVRDEVSVTKMPLPPEAPELPDGNAFDALMYCKSLAEYCKKLRDYIVKLQSEFATVTLSVRSNRSNNAVTIQDVAIILGDTDVSHRLGKSYQGWRISRLRGAQTVYEATTQPDKTKFLRLTGTGTATVDVEVW